MSGIYEVQLSKSEMVKEFRKFLDLKDANALANKLLAKQDRHNL